ncbi:MAG: class I SAM-dependent methyltransferase [Candidatus Thermoplasmatota archaeon]
MVFKKRYNPEKTWDLIAESFDETRNRPWSECMGFIDQVESDFFTADIACGNGRNLIPLAKRCRRCVGLDISKKLLKIVKKKASKKNITNIDLIHADASFLPFKNNILDSIVFIAGLHNIRSRQRRILSLKEIKRVKKEEGKALITVWSREQERFREYFKRKENFLDNFELGDIFIKWKKDGLNIPRFYHLYNKEEFNSDILKAGFKDILIKEVKICSKKYPDNYFAVVK